MVGSEAWSTFHICHLLTFEWQLARSNKRLGRLLVRVRAITQRRPLYRPRKPLLRQVARRVLLPEVPADRLVVRRGLLERLQRELAPCRLPDVTVARLPLLQEFSIVRRVGEDRDALVVLRSRAEKGDAADINLFDRVSERAVGLGDGVCERVEVADDDGDGGDLLGLEVRLVRGNRPREDA